LGAKFAHRNIFGLWLQDQLLPFHTATGKVS
jgi:hypothetical protein